MKIKVNDTVEVIAGDDKGMRGKVLSVDHQTSKIVVEGVHRVYKHVRRSQKTAKELSKAASKDMEYLDIPAFLRRQAN